MSRPAHIALRGVACLAMAVVAGMVVGVAVAPRAMADASVDTSQASVMHDEQGEATGSAGEGVSRAIFELPVTGPILRGFQAPATPYGPGHRGVKIQAPAGVVVRASGAGVVHHAGAVAGVGWVSIDHGAGRLTSYGPVRALVGHGEAVAIGQRIGQVDGTALGTAGNGAMHWGLRVHGTYEDPLRHVRRQRPSLVGPGDLALVVGAMGRYPP